MNYEFFLIFERIVRLMRTLESDTPQKRHETSSMWLLLSFVNETKFVTGKDIARRFMVQPSTATQLIDRAVNQGFILRFQNVDDRRVHHLQVTRSGKKQIILLRRLFDDRASRALKYLSNDEHEHLLELLSKIARGLELEVRSKGRSLNV
jgi:DNA-binding MarR family transcriptional regulator